MSGTRPADGRGVALAAVAVAAVVAVLAAALGAVATMRASHRHAVDDAATAALGAATTGVVTVLSYDYRHLNQDFSRAEALLTPTFRKRYDQTTARAVRLLAAKYHAISSATVSAAGGVEASTDRAVVLAFVDQTVTNTQLAQPRLDRSRIKITLVHEGGRWLIDNLVPV